MFCKTNYLITNGLIIIVHISIIIFRWDPNKKKNGLYIHPSTVKEKFKVLMVLFLIIFLIPLRSTFLGKHHPWFARFLPSFKLHCKCIFRFTFVWKADWSFKWFHPDLWRYLNPIPYFVSTPNDIQGRIIVFCFLCGLIGASR